MVPRHRKSEPYFGYIHDLKKLEQMFYNKITPAKGGYSVNENEILDMIRSSRDPAATLAYAIEQAVMLLAEQTVTGPQRTREPS